MPFHVDTRFVGRGKILLVDDSAGVRTFMHDRLTTAGFEVATCEEPFASLAAIERERPDLVLMDLAMPHMGGGRLISIIRHNQLFGTIPIVLFSGRPEAEVAAEAARVGADGYLLKTGDALLLDKFEELFARLVPSPRAEP